LKLLAMRSLNVPGDIPLRQLLANHTKKM